jgi:septal ring factor EnvC (AmiA/AmiB activator)
LQKGFLSRDQAPKDEDMANMADYLKQLEAHEDLEAEVIKRTKVHKVLKAIIKLDNIPKEEEHNFKQRSIELLNKWSGTLAADGESATTSATPATNGVKADDEKSESAKAETPAVEKKEEAKEEAQEETVEEKKDAEEKNEEEKNEEEKKDDAPAEPAAPEPADKDGDVSMADVEATKEAPAIIAAPNPDGAADAATESKIETTATTS